MVIGNAQRPKSFKKIPGTSLVSTTIQTKRHGLNLTYSTIGSLRMVGIYHAREEGRKVLLLLDNCFSHGSSETMSNLQNVRASFLPPNATRKLQPLEAGSLAWLMGKYRRRILIRIFENVEREQIQIYIVGIVIVIRWETKECDKFPPGVIKSCILHCFKYGDVGRKSGG